MDMFFYIISNIIIPIIVAMVTVILTAIINNKSVNSKIIIIYNKDKIEKNKEEYIYGNYKKNIEFENEFKKFLRESNYLSTSYINNLLFKTFMLYKNKEYINNNKIIENENSKISKMINYYKNDYDFVFHIKRFSVFYENSLWNFKVINIGKSTIYNVNIKLNKIVNNKKLISKDVLQLNEYIDINMIYFDLGIRINSFDLGYNIPFDFGYSKYTNLRYYIVPKRKCNKKDEILFSISYLDHKAKKCEYCFCSKIEIQK